MPKMKTNSSCKARFRKRGNGKIKRAKAYKRHHAWAKNPKRRRQLKGETVLFKGDERRVERMMAVYS